MILASFDASFILRLLNYVYRKKKDKKKSIDKRLQQISTGTDSGGEQAGNSTYVERRTKAELAFKRVKDKRACIYLH